MGYFQEECVHSGTIEIARVARGGVKNGAVQMSRIDSSLVPASNRVAQWPIPAELTSRQCAGGARRADGWLRCPSESQRPVHALRIPALPEPRPEPTERPTSGSCAGNTPERPSAPRPARPASGASLALPGRLPGCARTRQVHPGAGVTGRRGAHEQLPVGGTSGAIRGTVPLPLPPQ